MNARVVISCTLALGVLACSNIVGIGDLSPSGSGSSSGGGTGASPTAFLGTWTVTMGSNTVTCQGRSQTTMDTGSLVIATGTASDLSVSIGAGCDLAANIMSATTATLLPGQSCTQSESGGTVTLDPNGSFVLAPGGQTATADLSGTATDSSSGQTVDCSYTEHDSYARQ